MLLYSRQFNFSTRVYIEFSISYLFIYLFIYENYLLLYFFISRLQTVVST